MDLDKYKRDFKYKSTEGDKSFKWMIILGGIIIAILAYFLN